MENTKDILCPDCESEYISSLRFYNKGKCIQCERRQKMAEKKGKEYIPICKLSKKEQKSIFKRRKAKKVNVTKSVSTQNEINTKQKLVVRGAERKYSDELLEYCINLKQQGYTGNEIVENVQQTKDANINKKGLLSAIWRYENNKYNENNKIDNKSSKVNPIIKTTIINKDNLDKIGVNIKEEDLVEKDKQFKQIYKEGVMLQQEKQNLIKDYMETKQELQNLDEDAVMLQLKHKVDKVAEKKFITLNCNEPETYNTDSYIQMLEMLQYLSYNVQQILKSRQTQHDIMNAYQDDVLHEIEKSEIVKGDNLLQAKLQIVRNKRRYYEYDYNDIGIMKQFLECIDLKKLGIVLGQLKKFKEVREHPVFIPSVDDEMINKYDWVVKPKKEINIRMSKITSTVSVIHKVEEMVEKDETVLADKFKQKFTTPEEFFQINKDTKVIKRKQPVVNKYRVSCKLSGGGFGAFRLWYKDYTCINEELAESFAKQELENLKKKHKGILITELDVTKINT